MTTQTPAILLISPDLLFAGKIRGAADPLGLRVFQESEPAGIQRVLAEHPIGLVLLDLNVRSLAVADVMELLPSESRPTVAAFGPHVNTVRLNEAREAGCEHVLPRSRFVVELPDLLQHALGDD